MAAALLTIDIQSDFIGSQANDKLRVHYPENLIEKITTLASAFRSHGEVVHIKTEFTTRGDEAERFIVHNLDEKTEEERIAKTTIRDRYGKKITIGKLLKRQGVVGVNGQQSSSKQNDSSPSPFYDNFLASRSIEESNMLASSYGQQFVHPLPFRDHQITKNHYSSFFDSTGPKSLLHYLRSKLITVLYLTGSLSNVGVYATALEAINHNFEVILIEDCLGYLSKSRHDLALNLLKEDFDNITHTMKSSELISDLRLRTKRLPLSEDDRALKLAIKLRLPESEWTEHSDEEFENTDTILQQETDVESRVTDEHLSKQSLVVTAHDDKSFTVGTPESKVPKDAPTDDRISPEVPAVWHVNDENFVVKDNFSDEATLIDAGEIQDTLEPVSAVEDPTKAALAHDINLNKTPSNQLPTVEDIAIDVFSSHESPVVVIREVENLENNMPSNERLSKNAFSEEALSKQTVLHDAFDFEVRPKVGLPLTLPAPTPNVEKDSRTLHHSTLGEQPQVILELKKDVVHKLELKEVSGSQLPMASRVPRLPMSHLLKYHIQTFTHAKTSIMPILVQPQSMENIVEHGHAPHVPIKIRLPGLETGIDEMVTSTTKNPITTISGGISADELNSADQLEYCATEEESSAEETRSQRGFFTGTTLENIPTTVPILPQLLDDNSQATSTSGSVVSEDILMSVPSSPQSLTAFLSPSSTAVEISMTTRSEPNLLQFHIPYICLPKIFQGGTGIATNLLSDPDTMFAMLKPPNIVYHQISHGGRILPYTTAIQAEPNRNYWPLYRTDLWETDEAPKTTPFSEAVEGIRQVVEMKTGGHKFNHCVLQMFPPEDRCVGNHSDATLDIKPATPIVVVVLSPGHRHQVYFTPKFKSETDRQWMSVLDHNSMLQISLETNSEWMYTIWPSEKESVYITLTFRVVSTFLDKGEKWITNYGNPRIVANPTHKTKLRRELQDYFLADLTQPDFDWNSRDDEGPGHESVFNVLHMNVNPRTKNKLHLRVNDNEKTVEEFVGELRVKIVLAHFEIPWTAGNSTSVMAFSDGEKNCFNIGERDIIAHLETSYNQNGKFLIPISDHDREIADMLLRSWNEDVKHDRDPRDLSLRRLALPQLISYWKGKVQITPRFGTRRSYFAGDEVGLLDYYLWAIFHVCLVLLPKKNVSQELHWGRWTLSEVRPNEGFLHWYHWMSGLVAVNTALRYKG